MGLFGFFKGKPDPPNKDKIVQRAFAQLEQLLLPASVATLGGQKPIESPLTSRFAGDFVMLQEEEWPSYEGKALQAFLQVNTTELPFLPEELKGIQILTVFVEERSIPFDQPHGHGWVIRCYRTADGLMARKNPIRDSKIIPYEITWSIVNDDAPDWDDIPTSLDLKEFNALKDSIELLEGRFKKYELTKLGGWPSLIQSELEMGAKNFLFQIGSEEKARWNCVDAGIMYFGKVNGAWKFECQFY